MTSTHRLIQLSALQDDMESRARVALAASANAARIGNLTASSHFANRADRFSRIATKCEARISASWIVDATAAVAADHWDSLADAEEDMARWQENNGLPFGDTGTYHHRAEAYRRAAKTLWLQAETGKAHCSTCLGDHPNHEHMYAQP